MPLAKKLAFQKKKIVPRFIDVDDLISAAYVGLVEAASRFDETKGVLFQTFAYPRISGSINDYLRSCGMMQGTGDEYDLSQVAEQKQGGDGFEDILDVVTRNLDSNAKGILKLYFEEDLPMKEVGARFGVSESRISQILSRYKKDIRQEWAFNELMEEIAA
jgi:RNA polymerase sigma factor (sigma-70 family)